MHEFPQIQECPNQPLLFHHVGMQKYNVKDIKDKAIPTKPVYCFRSYYFDKNNIIFF
jgi:hypothetical protein